MSAITQKAYEEMTTDELFALYREHPSNELKWEIALRYTGLIRSVALQIRGVYCSFAQLDDIVNEGVIVLADAVEKYDPEKGRFDTYVSKRIRGMIIDLARQQDWIPRTVRKRAKEIEHATAELYGELARFPTAGEVAEYLHITEGEYQEAMANASMYSIISLDELFEGYEHAMENPADDPTQVSARMTPEQAVQNKELLQALTRAVASLKENEQMVLSLYYQKELKMKDIASVLGVSAPRVSQVHARAISKLKILMSEYMGEKRK